MMKTKMKPVRLDQHYDAFTQTAAVAIGAIDLAQWGRIFNRITSYLDGVAGMKQAVIDDATNVRRDIISRR